MIFSATAPFCYADADAMAQRQRYAAMMLLI